MLAKLCASLFICLLAIFPEGKAQNTLLDTNLIWLGCSHNLGDSLIYWISNEDTNRFTHVYKKVYLRAKGDTIFAGGMRETADSVIYGFFANSYMEHYMYDHKVGQVWAKVCDESYGNPVWAIEGKDYRGKNRSWVWYNQLPALHVQKDTFNLRSIHRWGSGFGSNLGLLSPSFLTSLECKDTSNWLMQYFPLSIGIHSVITRDSFHLVWVWQCGFSGNVAQEELERNKIQVINSDEKLQLEGAVFSGYRLFSVMGVKIAEDVNTNEKITIFKNTLRPGWYTCEVITQDNRSLRYKFVVY